MNYSEQLKKLREEQNLKQDDLALILKISRPLYAQYENQLKIIPLYHLNTISNYYNISIDYLLGLSNIKIYENYKTIENINLSLLGINLKELRKKNAITLTKLAKLLNTSHSTLSAYEHGKVLILTSFLYTICKEYNISADYLLGKTDEPKYLNN